MFQEIDAMFPIQPKQEYIDQALRLIDNFERYDFERPGHQPAFNLGPLSIARGMRERVNDPWKINQQDGSLCGPAAFFYCLLNTRPHQYVSYVINLYYDGLAMINDLVVRPSQRCRAFTPHPEQISNVDWIALASLRDSTNSDFAYSTTDREYAGITMPHDMVSWFTKAGFSGVTDRTNLLIGKRTGTLLEANGQLLASRFVCMFVNWNIVSYEHYTDFSFHPDHWIVLDAPLQKCEPGEIRFSVYSNGAIVNVPPYGGRLGEANLTKYFYGYVSAAPY